MFMLVNNFFLFEITLHPLRIYNAYFDEKPGLLLFHVAITKIIIYKSLLLENTLEVRILTNLCQILSTKGNNNVYASQHAKEKNTITWTRTYLLIYLNFLG